jgi:hypothetical protein
MMIKGLKSEWSDVFYISSVIFFIGGVVFSLFGTSDLEEWAMIENDNKNDE